MAYRLFWEQMRATAHSKISDGATDFFYLLLGSSVIFIISVVNLYFDNNVIAYFCVVVIQDSRLFAKALSMRLYAKYLRYLIWGHRVFSKVQG